MRECQTSRDHTLNHRHNKECMTDDVNRPSAQQMCIKREFDTFSKMTMIRPTICLRRTEKEDLEDYTKDYYESEGESDDGDGEATF